MKKRLTFVTAFFALTLIFLSSFTAFATNAESELWNNIGLYSPEKIQPTTSPIVSFDVSDSEQIALAFENDSILILDSEGNRQKQFCFHINGTYDIAFNGENLVLYLVRGNCVVEFTLDGKLHNIRYINGDAPIWKELREKNAVTVQNITYELRKAPATIVENYYAQLVKIDPVGNETVLYDLSGSQLARNILMIIVFVVSFIGVPLFFVRIIVKSVKERRALNPAPPQKLKPISKKKKVLKWAIFALFAVKLCFTVITFVTRSDLVSLFSVFCVPFFIVTSAFFKGNILLILFVCLAMLSLGCTTIGLIFLLSMRRQPKPAAVMLSIILMAGIVCQINSIFSGAITAVNLLPVVIFAILFNILILALIFLYTREFRKEPLKL